MQKVLKNECGLSTDEGEDRHAKSQDSQDNGGNRQPQCRKTVKQEKQYRAPTGERTRHVHVAFSFRMVFGCPHQTALPYTTLFGFRRCAAHGRICLNHCSQQTEVSYLTIRNTVKFESPVNIESYTATKTIRVLDSMFTHDNNLNSR